MMDWLMSLFQGSTALVTFFSIFAAGMVFTLFSLVFGGDFEHDVDHGDADHGHGGPGVLSVRGLSLLSTGFGGAAFIVQKFTGKVLLSSVSGLMFGWVFAFVLLAMLRIFIRQQASSALKVEQVLGAEGVVTTSIPAGGHGEVQLTAAGTQITRMATAGDGGEIPHGTPVRVVRYFGGSVVVEKATPDEGKE